MTNHSNIRLDQDELAIINAFEKDLERIFYTDTKVVICPSNDDLISLAVEIESNYSLSEIISFLKLPLNKASQDLNLNKTLLRFENAVYTLNKSLHGLADIEEISMYFRNTFITISSVERNSIMEDARTIVKNIVEHYIHYSTLMGAIPNEIHIPVMEHHLTKELFDKTSAVNLPLRYSSPYSQYWGLYFDSLQKPLIYSLNGTNITPGDIDLSLE